MKRPFGPDSDEIPREAESALSDTRRSQLHRLRAALQRLDERLDRPDLLDEADDLRAAIDAALGPHLSREEARARYAHVTARLDIFLGHLTRIGAPTDGGVS